MAAGGTQAARAPGWTRALEVIGGFVLLLWVVELVDVLLGNRLDGFGVQPLDPDGLDGIVLAPLLHYGWSHLAANTPPLLVLGFLILLAGVSRWLAVTAVVWLVSGAGTWVLGGPGSLHLGASGLVFGWLTYLLVVGVLTRRPGQIAVGVVVFLIYGSVLWGVLPLQAGVSWQAHLFGAVGGIVAARMVAKRLARRDGAQLGLRTGRPPSW